MLRTPELLAVDIPDNGRPGSTHRLTCTQWGNPQAARTVLCVHGLTRNGRDFDFLADLLAGDCRVLCPDMPGRGQSQWLADPKGYTNPAYVADVIYLLRHLNIARVDWIGTSMGGIMGMMAVGAYPGLIESLALNDIGCFIPASGMQRIRDIASLPTVFSSRAEAEAALRKRCASFGIREEAHWRHLFAYGIQDNGDGRVRAAYDPAIFSVGFSADIPVTDVDLWPLWEKIESIPVLLIRGMQSDILHRQTALEMQARHPRLALHEIENTGHAPALMDDKQKALIHNWISAKK